MNKPILEIITTPNPIPLLIILNQVSFVDGSKEKIEILITNVSGVEKLITFSDQNEMMRCLKFIREILTGTDFHTYNLFIEGDPFANLKVNKNKQKSSTKKMTFGLLMGDKEF